MDNHRIAQPIVSTIYLVEAKRSILCGGPSAGIAGIHRWTFDAVSAGPRVTTEEIMVRRTDRGEPGPSEGDASSRVVFERTSIRLGGRSDRLSSSFEAASEPRGFDARRPLHYDKPGSRKMVHKSAGDDLGHDLVRVVDAFAAPISHVKARVAARSAGSAGVRDLDASGMAKR